MYARFGSFVVVHVVAGVLPRPSKAKTSSVVQNKKNAITKQTTCVPNDGSP